MTTFFSGTDQSTLQEEGTDKDFFVSLIVNNAGNYTAGITRKVTYKEVKSGSYTDIDGTVVTGHKIEEEKQVIEWFSLKIDKATEDKSDMHDLYIRINNIKDVKKTSSPVYSGHNNYNAYSRDDWEYPIKNTSNSILKEVKDKDDDQPTLFDTKSFESSLPKAYNTASFSAADVDRIARQIITGCVLTTEKVKYSNEEFAKAMEPLYEKVFHSDMKRFEEWSTSFIEFLFFESVEDDPTELMSAVVKKLSSYKSNKYLTGYIECINSYILY